MFAGPSTSWRLIEGAARGSSLDRDAFVARYCPLVRAYLDSRWRGGPLEASLEDAIQDVFVECLRQDGVLVRAQAVGLESFRAFLLGVVRNVARRAEREADRTPRRNGEIAREPIDRSQTASAAFDRAWAKAIVAEALELQRRNAETLGERALRRVELLRLRFEAGLPVRDVAARWGEPAAHVHREYLAARRDYKTALETVLRLRLGESTQKIEEAVRELRRLLS